MRMPSACATAAASLSRPARPRRRARRYCESAHLVRPDDDGLVCAARGEALPVARVRHREHRVLVPLRSAAATLSFALRPVTVCVASLDRARALQRWVCGLKRPALEQGARRSGRRPTLSECSRSPSTASYTSTRLPTAATSCVPSGLKQMSLTTLLMPSRSGTRSDQVVTLRMVAARPGAPRRRAPCGRGLSTATLQ